MKQGMIRAGLTVVVLIVMATALSFVMGFIRPDVHPIVTYGTVLCDWGNIITLRADDGFDIELYIEDGGTSLPYTGEHGVFYYVPSGEKSARGAYDLLAVRDLNTH